MLRSPSDDCVPGLYAPQARHSEILDWLLMRQVVHCHVDELVKVEPQEEVGLDGIELDHPANDVPVNNDHSRLTV